MSLLLFFILNFLYVDLIYLFIFVPSVILDLMAGGVLMILAGDYGRVVLAISRSLITSSF